MKYDIRHTVLCLDSEDSKHFDLILTNTFCSDQSQILVQDMQSNLKTTN